MYISVKISLKWSSRPTSSAHCRCIWWAQPSRSWTCSTFHRRTAAAGRWPSPGNHRSWTPGAGASDYWPTRCCWSDRAVKRGEEYIKIWRSSGL